MCARLPERLQEAAKQCFAHWPEYCMWKIDAMETLVRELRAKGYGLYICSNASIRLPSVCMDVIPAAECFDGMLFSAEIKYLKPQKEMYEHLFRRFGLKPEECYFIDDLPMNIEGAKACGMDGHCFADGSVENLRKDLEDMVKNGYEGYFTQELTAPAYYLDPFRYDKRNVQNLRMYME